MQSHDSSKHQSAVSKLPAKYREKRLENVRCTNVIVQSVIWHFIIRCFRSLSIFKRQKSGNVLHSLLLAWTALFRLQPYFGIQISFRNNKNGSERDAFWVRILTFRDLNFNLVLSMFLGVTQLFVFCITEYRSDLIMPLCMHRLETYQETSSHATRQGTPGHSRLSLLSHNS